MSWNKQLGKDWKGSRPRCVLLMSGDRAKVAKRLTKLVGLPDVSVSPSDNWMPYGKPCQKEDSTWDKTPANEARLNQANCLVYPEKRNQLRDWWLCHGGNTPVWDIASTCSINGERGLILIEAKAHDQELDARRKSLSKSASENSRENHEQIGRAIEEANCRLQSEIGGDWNLSRDSHYQLSNRFAWSWKLASLKIPVVLVYLGFLNACDMDSANITLFHSKSEWENILKRYCKDKIDNTCWEQPLYFNDTPFIPVIRACNQTFDPNNP